MYQPPIRPNEIYHYGIKRRSGRYPWGSGERPYQSMSISEKKQEALSRNKDTSSKDRTIKKGSVCRKVQTGGSLTTLVDFSKEGGERSKGSPKYKTMTDVKIPSNEKLTEVIIEEFMKDPKVLNRSIRSYRTRNQDVENAISSNEIRNKLVSNPNEIFGQIIQDAFYKSAWSQTGKRPRLDDNGTKIRQRLIREGYNGIPDLSNSDSEIVYLLLPYLEKVE